MGFGRTHNINEVNSTMMGHKVVLCGWVEDFRALGKMTFLTIHDVTGISQIVIKGELNDKIQNLNRQNVVRIGGIIQDTKAHDFEYEILAKSVDILGKAVHPLPVDPTGRLESNIDNRLNARALDLRNRKTAAIFKIRANVLSALRNSFIKKKFIEINTPKIIGSASEGGANLFSLEYFGSTAYLAQSPQLYKEQMTIGLERVFEIASFYRAEKSHTRRHLSEFTSVDIEAAFMNYSDVMYVLESLVYDVYSHIVDHCKKEQEAIGCEITVPKAPFPRISYYELIEEINKSGENLKFGDDLLDSHLRIIGNNHPGFFFIVDWPLELKPFYIKENEKDSKLSESFDLQYGFLELSSGGTRLHDPDVIKSRLKDQQLDPKLFEDHLRTFDWGMPPHAGWGMGLERLLTTLIGIDNVREVVLYPRDPERLTP